MKSVHARSGWIGLAPLLLALVALAGWGPAESGEDEAPGFMAAKGRVTYRIYCASCHGQSGKGDGHLAQYLTVQPADLTGISLRRDGEFPRDEVGAIIDGRREARGHGPGDMPVWGDVFQSPLSETEAGPSEEPEDRVDRKIAELVLFLESIQAEPSPTE